MRVFLNNCHNNNNNNNNNKKKKKTHLLSSKGQTVCYVVGRLIV